MKQLSLKFLTLCDYATVSQEGKLSIVGIFDRIFTEKTPSSFIRMFIVAIIEGEPSGKYEVELNIKDPLGKKVLTPMNLKIELSVTGRSNFITDVLNMPIPQFGEYSLEIKSGDKSLGSTVFWVSRAGGRDGRKKNDLPN